MSNNHEDHGAEGNNQFIFPMRALFKNNPNQNIHDSDTNSKSNNNTNPSDVDKPWHYANFDRRKSLTSMVSSTTGTDRAEPRGIDRSIHSTNPNIPLPGEANERDFEGYDGPTFQEEAEREMDAAESGMEDLSESGTDNQSTSKVTEKQSEPTRLQPETAAQAMEAHKTKLDNYRHSKVSKEPVIGSPVPTDSTSTDDVSASSLNDENASEELPKTKRFEFCQSEDDYYLITHHHDNKAKLKKCEDEPIATPGAIQSYGCLIVLEEDENGNAVIRQASENTSEIIGCSPSQLFSIPCFTYVLDNNSRLTLRDVMFDLNSESDYDEGDSKSDSSDYKKDKIQVFSISGKGHSDISDQYSDDEGSVESSNNKSWSCWCCIHKPELPKPINKNYPPANEVFVSSLYILELEPVITYKYPPFVDDVSKMPKEMDERDMKPAGSLDLNISEKGPSTGDESTAHASGSSTKKTGTSMSTDTLHAVPTPGGNFHLEDDNENYVGDSHATAEEIRRSTTPLHKDLKTLHRIRRSERAQETRRRVADLLEETAYENENDELKDKRRKAQKRILARQRIRNYIEKPGNLSSLDTIALLGEINDQLSRVDDIDKFMGVAVGIVKDLTRFHRVMMYRFDQQTWDGEVVAELVDWRMCKELFYGLHFPGSDIPAQARDLYKRNKVRQLYDRDLLTSRIVCRNKIDLMYPLDMSNCSLRAMSPVHLQYLKNMRVKASLSISVIAFGQLHGLIACHSFGDNGMRVNFPMFEILKLLSDAISRNIERLAYTRRLQSRKLISTAPSETSPGGYIASTAMDLLTIFEASYGILSIGDSMKVLGDMEKNVSKEIVAIGEFLRLKNFEPMVYTNNISSHFPELQDNIKIIAGLLYIPLSKSGGHDFIAFLRTGQLQEIKWAGNPFRKVTGSLEPRSSFKTWTEKVISISKPWENEQLETASVLGVVYGKFIEIWRQRTELNKANQFSQILISNASHEVRTPLNHIINYIELALDGNLDSETRENLKRSHEASKSLLFTINDLLDLTKVDSGHEVLFNEPINIKLITAEAVNEYHGEAERRDVTLSVECSQAPSHVVSDYRKVNTILKSLLSNAIKYNKPGGFVNVHVAALEKESDNRANVALDIEDNGIGISGSKLEALFRGFEKVDYTKVEESSSDSSQDLVLGLGLASCARAVEQLDGQLKCQSEPKKGTKFSVIIPFNIPDEHDVVESASNSDSSNASDRSFRIRYRHSSKGKSNPSTISSGNESTYIGQQIQRMERSELDSFVDALAPSNQSNFIKDGKSSTSNHSQPDKDSVGSNKSRRSHLRNGDYNVQDSAYPIRAGPLKSSSIPQSELGQSEVTSSYSSKSDAEDLVKGIEELDVSKIDESKTPLKVLYVDDDPINRNILRKRLSRDKMEVDLANNGEDAINVITSKSEYHYDVILMDLLMPILDGWECTKKIRSLESDGKIKSNNSIKNCLPILAVSASISPLDHDKLRDCGFVGFFTKPIDFKILTDLIESLYDHKKWNDNLYDKNSGRSFEKGGFIMAPEK